MRPTTQTRLSLTGSGLRVLRGLRLAGGKKREDKGLRVARSQRRAGGGRPSPHRRLPRPPVYVMRRHAQRCLDRCRCSHANTHTHSTPLFFLHNTHCAWSSTTPTLRSWRIQTSCAARSGSGPGAGGAAWLSGFFSQEGKAIERPRCLKSPSRPHPFHQLFHGLRPFFHPMRATSRPSLPPAIARPPARPLAVRPPSRGGACRAAVSVKELRWRRRRAANRPGVALLNASLEWNACSAGGRRGGVDVEGGRHPRATPPTSRPVPRKTTPHEPHHHPQHTQHRTPSSWKSWPPRKRPTNRCRPNWPTPRSRVTQPKRRAWPAPRPSWRPR